MFEVSFPTNFIQNWLLEQLDWIIKNEEELDPSLYFNFYCYSIEKKNNLILLTLHRFRLPRITVGGSKIWFTFIFA